MVVSFVNSKSGHSGQTSSMLAIAMLFAVEDQKRVLVLHTGIKSKTLEQALLGKNEAEMGIDELKRCFMQKQLSEEDINLHCYTFCSDKLYLLAGTKSENKEMYEEIMQKLMPVMLKELNKYFDYIFVDLESCEGELTSEIIGVSDSLVISLSQNPEEAKDAFELKNRFSNTESFFLMGRYDKKSSFDYGYMRRVYMGGRGKRLGVIPYCSGCEFPYISRVMAT